MFISINQAGQKPLPTAQWRRCDRLPRAGLAGGTIRFDRNTVALPVMSARMAHANCYRFANSASFANSTFFGNRNGCRKTAMFIAGRPQPGREFRD
jgi:hypothetical protein